MIQEPRPDLIEIPTLAVETIIPKMSNPIKTYTTNQLNCKQRTTLVQIPKQNSKPRIFLLTRPAKKQLVRIVTTQTEQDHTQKDLNLLQLHHPEKVNIQEKLAPIEQSQAIQAPRKVLIQTPQKVVTQYPLKKPQSVLKLKESLVVHQEIIQYPKTKTISSLPVVVTSASSVALSNQSIKQTIQENNTVKLVEKKTEEMRMLKEAVPPLPLTLASMAGIELTGADMTITAADMSGAMPPTATVEEINVPVFIDEYLQEAAISTAASTTSSSVTTSTNILYNINNNNISNNYQQLQQKQQNGKGNRHDCFDTFENFEFDIDLLTESIAEDQNKASNLEQQPILIEQQLQQNQQQTLLSSLDEQQQLSNNLDDSTELEKGEDHLDLMLDEILFNNNNNTSNYNIKSCTNNNNKNNFDTNNNKNNNKMANGMTDVFVSDEEALFNWAPNSQDQYMYDIDLSNYSPTIENAINFNQIGNDDWNIMDAESENQPSYFIHSQPNDTLLSSVVASTSSASSMQNGKSSVAALSQEIMEAEPHVSPEAINYNILPSYIPSLTTPPSPGALQQCDDSTINEQNDFFDVECPIVVDCGETKVNPLKRNSVQTIKHMQEKRSKLYLDTKRLKEVDTEQHDIDTPNIINCILQNEESIACAPSPAETSMDAIFNQLINSPHETIVKSEVDDYTNDLSRPYTPYSVNSTSNQTSFTGFIDTAPNSPASSIATSTINSVSSKRGRGRPAKQHSDKPDISRIQHLPETEKKKLMERYKNNEASRKSRLKNKERDLALEMEEQELSVRNQQLKFDLEEQKRIEHKFRRALRRKYFQGSP